MIKEAIKPWFTDFYRVLDPVTEKLVENLSNFQNISTLTLIMPPTYYVYRSED